MARRRPLQGLWKLAWLEIKVFLREPMGAVGTIGMPVLLFVVMSRVLGKNVDQRPRLERLLQDDLPIFVVVLLAISSVLSLTAIISIYREGGILKRLRATPLSPITILTSHVIVKLVFTVLTLGLLTLAGRRFYVGQVQADLVSLLPALVLVMVSILSIGFVIASLVPTARFAQPLGSILLYSQIPLSGLFLPLDVLPPVWQSIAHALPITHAVALLRDVWGGGSFFGSLDHVAALLVTFGVCTALASRVFRWE